MSYRQAGVRALLWTAALGLSGCVSVVTHTTERVERCQPVTEAEVAALFDGWNHALHSGDAQQVVARYAPNALLLPTLSNTPRLTPAEKADYFEHFLENQPHGVIDQRRIELGCNQAWDAGLYTFHFARTGQHASGRYTFNYRWNGETWVISHHHSSLLPEVVAH